MAVDAAMRKLKVPPRFMPYLEKHRIYELFHDLGNQLAMAQPEDPLLFLRLCLQRLHQARDRRLVVLMAPPYLDRIKLAHLLSVRTGCGILSRYIVCQKPGNYYDPDALAVDTAHFVSTSEKEGWILADFPDTVEEAKLLIQFGVLPTRAFIFLPNERENEQEENENLRSVDTTPSILLEYDNTIYRLRELFKSSLKVVKIKDRSLEDIANFCARLTMNMPPRLAPKYFRVVLIGPRGSRRRILASVLHKKFNLVHVDMEHLINTARSMENELGDEIRFLDKHTLPYPNKIVFDLLKTRLYQKDCLDHGYVLTNFPCGLEDFVLLDTTDTPPNRVIFLDIDGSECQARLEDRVVNMYTGHLHSKRAISDNALLKSQILTHPDDESCKVSEEIKFYNRRVEAMVDYCGKTCSVVDARGPVTALLERVEAVLMGPSPAAKPRSGKLPPRYYVKEKSQRQSASSVGSRMSYPTSYTQVVPLINSAELLRRFIELKEGSNDQQSVSVESKGILIDKAGQEYDDNSMIPEGSMEIMIDKAGQEYDDKSVIPEGSTEILIANAGEEYSDKYFGEPMTEKTGDEVKQQLKQEFSSSSIAQAVTERKVHAAFGDNDEQIYH